MTTMATVPRITQAPTVMVTGVHPLRPHRRTAGGDWQLTARRHVSTVAAPLLRGAGRPEACPEHPPRHHGHGRSAEVPSKTPATIPDPFSSTGAEEMAELGQHSPAARGGRAVAGGVGAGRRYHPGVAARHRDGAHQEPGGGGAAEDRQRAGRGPGGARTRALRSGSASARRPTRRPRPRSWSGACWPRPRGPGALREPHP